MPLFVCLTGYRSFGAYLQLPPSQTTGGMECFRGEHWWYVVPGATLFVVYVGLSARLMRAGGQLQNIEMVWHNPFDWRGDNRKRMSYKHALSLAKNQHAMGTVAIKTPAVLATIFLGTRHPAVVAAVRVFSTCPALRPAVLAHLRVLCAVHGHPRLLAAKLDAEIPALL